MTKETNENELKAAGGGRGRTLWANIALLTAAVVWGSAFIVMKDTLDSVPVCWLLFMRFGGGALILSAIFVPRLKNIDKQYLWRGGIIGLALFGGYLTQTIGLTDTTPGKSAFLTAAYCVMVPFMFWATTKKKPDIYNILAAFMCVGGVGLVSLTESFTVSFGDGFTLIGAIFYAAQIITIAMFAEGRDPILLTIIQFAAAAVLSLISAVIFEPFPAIEGPEMILTFVYLAAMPTALAILLQNVGQKFTKPAQASIILSLESVFGVLFSVMFYDEKLSLRLVAGFVLIFAAVIVSETKLSFLRLNKR